MKRFNEYLIEGGNTPVKNIKGNTINPERIPLDIIGRSTFVKTFQKFFLKFNAMFEKEYGNKLWADEKEIMNAGIFNGSTSFIMADEVPDDELLKYKKSAGDIDVAFPKEYAEELFSLLSANKDKEIIPGVKYIGNNKEKEGDGNKGFGNTIIAVFQATFKDISVYCQVDFELSDFENNKQTDYSKMAHSSSFKDAKAGMKGVASKFLLRALVGASSEIKDGFILLTPASTAEKYKLPKSQPSSIRILSFGLDQGIGAKYELIKTKDGEPFKIDGKIAYRQYKSGERSYDKTMSYLIKIAFGGKVDNKVIKPKQLHAFVDILDIMKKYMPKSKYPDVRDRLSAALYGNGGGMVQAIEPKYPDEDIKLKTAIYDYFCKTLKLQPNPNLDSWINYYMEKVHKK